MDLAGSEAKELGSLPRESGTGKAIEKGIQSFTPWRQLLSALKERYPFKEDLVFNPGIWTTMEKGIQYSRELSVVEMMYGINLDNTSSQDSDDLAHQSYRNMRL